MPTTALPSPPQPNSVRPTWPDIERTAKSIYLLSKQTPPSTHVYSKLGTIAEKLVPVFDELVRVIDRQIDSVESMPTMPRWYNKKQVAFVITQLSKLSYYGQEKSSMICIALLNRAQRVLKVYSNHIHSKGYRYNQTTYHSETCPEQAANSSCAFHAIAFLAGTEFDRVLETGFRLHKHYAKTKGLSVDCIKPDEIQLLPGLTVVETDSYRGRHFELYTVQKFESALEKLEENSSYIMYVGTTAISVRTEEDSCLTIYDPHGLHLTEGRSAAYAQTFNQHYDAALFLTTFRPLILPKKTGPVATGEMIVSKVTFDREVFATHLKEVNEY